ncbi:MAG: SBBP repeat-containing protein [Bacteroidetes bacterium]|nr:SBBP repeat-containing protein [Bacteroidota bacterium]
MRLLSNRKNFLTKNYSFLLITAILFASNFFARGYTKPNDPEMAANAKTWMSLNKQLGFHENKGQMTGSDDKPASYVLFKAEVPGLNIWVTTSGLTYQFFEKEEDNNVEDDEMGQANILQGDKLKVKWKWSRVDMVLKNAGIKKENVVAEGDVTLGNVSYFFGHCPNGVSNVKTYTRITIREVYKGIDWVIYTSGNGGIKHDFIVHPKADPNQIKLIYEGNGKFEVKSNQIHFESELGGVTEGRLFCYQGEQSNSISSDYTIKSNIHPLYLGVGTLPLNQDIRLLNEMKAVKSEIFSYEIGIKLNDYNNAQTITIDPQLTWATFYGGNGADGPMSVDCDANNNVYVTGYTDNVAGTTFPLQAWGGAYFYTAAGYYGIFIMRFDPNGVLVWSTFYGSGRGHSITCDGAGGIYITGYTRGLPTYDPGGGAYYQSVFGGFNYDAFVLKFDNAGNRLWATYYGGASDEEAYSIALDGANNIYIVGYTSSNAVTFPLQTRAGAYNQGTAGGSRDAFILRFTNSGVLTWATYYGGSGVDEAYAIAFDAADNVYVTGYTRSSELTFPLQSWGGAYFDNIYGGGGNGDVFILRFTNSGVCTWATYYGGTGNDVGTSVACDASDNLYVVGYATSTAATFSLQAWAGAYNQAALGGGVDAFILRFTNIGTRTWATYYGGSGTDIPFHSYHHIEIDDCGNLYVSLNTTSSNIYKSGNTTCGNFYDSSFGGTGGSGYGDAFIIKFNNNGAVLWATYLGGNGADFREAIALDNNGNLYVVGEWCAGSGSIVTSTYPFTNPGGGAYYDNAFGGLDDGYIVKFSPVVPTLSQSQVNNTVCSPCSGSATVNIACADPNFNYTWSNGSQTLNSISSTNTISGLCPGTYTVTVTDGACVKVPYTATFSITGTACGSITANVNSAEVCEGASSCPVLIATATSGTSPYTYSWNTGGTTQSINPCPATTTTYTVQITDSGGATAASTAIVIVNKGVDVQTTLTNITCNGDANGSAIAVTGSGTSPYTYSWSNGQTTQSVTGLIQGTYTVKVTDNKGCTSTTTTSIISPPALTGLFTKGTAACNGCGCKEWLMVTGSGGTGPYYYNWQDGYMNRYKNQLCPGAHTINIRDKNGCSINLNLSTP